MRVSYIDKNKELRILQNVVSLRKTDSPYLQATMANGTTCAIRGEIKEILDSSHKKKRHLNLLKDRNRIISCVKRICAKKDIAVEVQISETTNTLYFNLSNEYAQVRIRISDHPQNKVKRHSVRSMQIKKNTTMAQIERYVNNSIKDLYRRSVNNAFKELEE